MSEGLGYFAAVYRDGRVHIGNKSYAAGVYAVHLLNQYYKNDTAARIAVYKQYILQVRRQLEIGYLNESDFEKAGEEIQSILKTLPKLKPFDTIERLITYCTFVFCYRFCFLNVFIMTLFFVMNSFSYRNPIMPVSRT